MQQPITTSAYTFEITISGNYLYVDKTDYFYELIKNQSGIFFLSRPRRFGKSLSVSILKNIFKGNKELFKGLKIYDMPYDWKSYPVINLNISKANCTSAELLRSCNELNFTNWGLLHNSILREIRFLKYLFCLFPLL